MLPQPSREEMHLQLGPPVVHTVVEVVKIFFPSLLYEGGQHCCFMAESGRGQ